MCRLGTAFSGARIKGRNFRNRNSRGRSFMIPSHSFSTSVSLQTKMPKKKLVVKKKIKQTYIKGDEVKETAKNYKLTHRNTL